MSSDEKLTLLLRQMASLQQTVERCEAGLRRCEGGMEELRAAHGGSSKGWFAAIAA